MQRRAALILWSLAACGVPEPGAKPGISDADRDGTEASADCDDDDPGSTIRSEDADCDGVITGVDCDDTDASVGACDTSDSGVTVDSGDTGDSGDSGEDTGPSGPQGGQALAHPTLGTLRYVPPGRFGMGCGTRDNIAGGCLRDEGPTRGVELTTGVWMMESEFTQGMWEALGFSMNPSSFSGPTRPVEMVNWWDALEAANEASRRDGLAVCYALEECTIDAVGAGRACAEVTITSTSGHTKDCEGWRLPTEAEWEYAARAGTDLPYSGSAELDEVAWYSETSDGQTQPVCTTPTPRNAWGLCDMTGNVWEWTLDGFIAYFRGTVTDPVGSWTSRYVVARGGGLTKPPRAVRIPVRLELYRGDVYPSLGFRLVRSAP